MRTDGTWKEEAHIAKQSGQGEEGEESVQSEVRIHQRWRNTPSRPTFPPHKSLQTFFFTARSARLKEGRPVGQAFMMEPRFAKCCPPSVQLLRRIF